MRLLRERFDAGRPVGEPVLRFPIIARVRKRVLGAHGGQAQGLIPQLAQGRLIAAFRS
jgi:hypothetical protein